MSKIRFTTVAALMVLVAGACRDGAGSSTAPSDTNHTAEVVSSTSAACYDVSGNIMQSGAFPLFTGTISGDIEGTISTLLNPASLKFAGVTTHVAGVQQWTVTGGMLGALGDVDLEISAVNSASQVPHILNNVTARVVSGVAGGNLTYHGVIDVSGFPVQLDIDYHGVICP